MTLETPCCAHPTPDASRRATRQCRHQRMNTHMKQTGGNASRSLAYMNVLIVAARREHVLHVRVKLNAAHAHAVLATHERRLRATCPASIRQWHAYTHAHSRRHARLQQPRVHALGSAVRTLGPSRAAAHRRRRLAPCRRGTYRRHKSTPRCRRRERVRALATAHTCGRDDVTEHGGRQERSPPRTLVVSTNAASAAAYTATMLPE
jgi:hypothetical protein